MPRLSFLALLVVGLLTFDAAGARAQTAPPAMPPPPTVATPPAGDAVVPLGQPPPAAPAAPPAPMEAAPPPQATPPYAPSPALTAAPEPAPLPADRPFYKKRWFWGAVGVFVFTGIIIAVAVSSSGGPSTPNTTLGDMRAF